MGTTVIMLVVDTDVIIDISHGDTKAIDILAKHQINHELVISSITRYEVLVGCRNKQEMQAILKLLEAFRTLPLNETIAMIADELIITYALSHGLKAPDALIASTAIHYASNLLSKNQKDFRYITDLKLLAYE